ncbi:hypothetical protein VHEMI09054 [[Torrubiella] hemipterigena]|uniref:Polysaccharide export protein n=1 Tax=[Torrubiella] hemipterigena TaxID=1531966 RepID=A0A0A1TPL4_9HYPO|nr:hypothetical protein VHEMI09054 [[Torrubiella] hemipterigena]
MIVSTGIRLFLRRMARSRGVRIVVLLAMIVNFLETFSIYNRIAQIDKSSPMVHTYSKTERIYIASMHFNNEELLRNHWNRALLELVAALGEKNVFVNIYESGSWDDTKGALAELDALLEHRGIERRVEVSNTTHLDEIENPIKADGWIHTKRSKEKELRRIPYLSRLRNKTLQDLAKLAEEGVHFDKVLFLGDVVFTVDDVLTLMATNGGRYAATCSLDFSKPPLYYDTFALRDSKGQSHIMPTWPYFKSRGSRNALMHYEDAVSVASCWNGIVVMKAKPFTSSVKLRFRGVPDSLAKYHVEGSECCLIHADNPLSKTLGVYLNPRVRVGYNYAAYKATHPVTSWASPWKISYGIWANRISRWTTVTFERQVIHHRVKQWMEEDAANAEPGVFCLINEMQVLVENGWAHV